MSEQMQDPSSSPHGGTDTGTVPTTRWAPHGRALMACLVAVNISLVFLVYLYFWRIFSRKHAGSSAPGGDEDEQDASSSPSAPPADVSPGTNQDVVASLPVFVHSGALEKAAAECAVCIAELRDGDEMRSLPRCGHRFHAACVDVWLRLHTTCPLCRASVAVQPGGAEAEPGPEGGVPNTRASVDALA